MQDIDYLADRCPCCKGPRKYDAADADWPWVCACNQCEVVALGRTCARTAPCWGDCPYAVREGGCRVPVAERSCHATPSAAAV